MTALEYFRLFAPEFSSVNDNTVNQWFAVATALAETGCLDAERAAMAQAYYAAHQMALNASVAATGGAGGAVGPVTMEKEGDLQRSYGKISLGGDSLLGKTSYGLQYLDITKGCYGMGILTRVI